MTTMRDTLNWLPFKQVITYKLCLMMFKALNGLALQFKNAIRYLNCATQSFSNVQLTLQIWLNCITASYNNFWTSLHHQKKSPEVCVARTHGSMTHVFRRSDVYDVSKSVTVLLVLTAIVWRGDLLRKTCTGALTSRGMSSEMSSGWVDWFASTRYKGILALRVNACGKEEDQGITIFYHGWLPQVLWEQSRRHSAQNRRCCWTYLLVVISINFRQSAQTMSSRSCQQLQTSNRRWALGLHGCSKSAPLMSLRSSLRSLTCQYRLDKYRCHWRRPYITPLLIKTEHRQKVI